jgi:hypothetical protein
MKLIRVAPIAVLLTLAACETTNSSAWSGGQGTPFKHAERTCNELLPTIGKDESRRDFFIGCMQALGWTLKPGGSVNL